MLRLACRVLCPTTTVEKIESFGVALTAHPGFSFDTAERNGWCGGNVAEVAGGLASVDVFDPPELYPDEAEIFRTARCHCDLTLTYVEPVAATVFFIIPGGGSVAAKLPSPKDKCRDRFRAVVSLSKMHVTAGGSVERR